MWYPARYVLRSSRRVMIEFHESDKKRSDSLPPSSGVQCPTPSSPPRVQKQASPVEIESWPLQTHIEQIPNQPESTRPVRIDILDQRRPILHSRWGSISIHGVRISGGRWRLGVVGRSADDPHSLSQAALPEWWISLAKGNSTASCVPRGGLSLGVCRT